MKFFPLIILLVPLNLYAQETDTTSPDTIKITTDSLSVIQADTLVSDTTQVSIKDTIVYVDTLYPLYQKPYYTESFFISRGTIDLLDYRYTGDFFLPAGFSFLKDKGLIGQQNELILYGNGFGGTSFLSDGILYNNRFTSILDLNFMQSEMIDSVEILPTPRGFLYGPDNYLTAVNFIEKDFLTPAPYTRIKYYEGPEGEAFVDGMFNAFFMNRFNFTLGVTNRKFDGTYINSDFSIWQAKVKLKYFLSNKINLIGSYSLVSSEVGLNGGVDVDSISQITSDISNVLYNPQAPVVFTTLRHESVWNKFKLRALGKFGIFNSDLNFYYHSEIEKYSGITSDDEIKNYILGTTFRQSYSSPKLKMELNGVFEKRELNYYYVDTTSGFQREKKEYNVFSVSPVLSLYLLDSSLIPSVFYKYTNYSDISSSLHGFGTDITLKIFSIFNLYFGISRFDYIYGSETDLYEIGTKIKSKQLYADIKFYNRKNFVPSYILFTNTQIPSPINTEPSRDITGFAISVNYDFWKLGFEGRFNHNSFEENQSTVTSEIKNHFNGGIFYKDILFNNNLDLKTGFVIKYYDFSPQETGSLLAPESAYQLDFTVTGIIQKIAIIYFAWENLFNEKYFIVPYYPMRERGIRFGIAWELFN